MPQVVITSAALRLLNFFVYLGFRVCEGLIRLMPIDWAFSIGKFGGEVAYRVLWNRRAIGLGNLSLAFASELSQGELRALNHKHFQLLGANLVAGLKAATMPHEKIWQRVTASLPNDRRPSGWIALIAHIGNWELYSHLAEQFPEYRFGALYQPLANPFVDRYLRAARARSGITLFDRRTELLKCVRFLREGGVVGVLADQGAGYAGVWTPLFRRLTSSSTFPATLSIRTGVPVVPIAINTCGHARWHMTVSPPVYPTTDERVVLTAHINRLLEEQIRRAPADWLWAHKRWKPLRPHFLFSRDQRHVFFPPDFDRSTLDPFRILIVSPESSEEAVKTFAAVRTVKNGRPDTWLSVLCRAQLREIWKNASEIDWLIEWQEHESLFSIAAKIRRVAGFDVAIAFAPEWKTSLALIAARIPLRVGRRHGLVGWLYNQHPIELKQHLDSAQWNLHIARSVGATIKGPLMAAAREANVPPPI